MDSNSSIKKCLETQAILHFKTMKADEQEKFLELTTKSEEEIEKRRNQLRDDSIIADAEIEFVDDGFLASLKRKYPSLMYFVARPEFVLFSILPLTLILSYVFPGDKKENTNTGSAEGDGEAKKQEDDEPKKEK